MDFFWLAIHQFSTNNRWLLALKLEACKEAILYLFNISIDDAAVATAHFDTHFNTEFLLFEMRIYVEIIATISPKKKKVLSQFLRVKNRPILK